MFAFVLCLSRSLVFKFDYEEFVILDEGSMMNITCLVKDSPEPPNYIFWYHNDKVISTEKSDV